MDKHIKMLLQELARTCPATELQQEDWQRMYEICLYAHVNAMVLTPRMVRVFLHEHGCSVQKAAFLSHQVEHLSTILTLYDERRVEPGSRD
jgi:hypothetical protein